MIKLLLQILGYLVIVAATVSKEIMLKGDRHRKQWQVLYWTVVAAGAGVGIAVVIGDHMERRRGQPIEQIENHAAAFDAALDNHSRNENEATFKGKDTRSVNAGKRRFIEFRRGLLDFDNSDNLIPIGQPDGLTIGSEKLFGHLVSPTIFDLALFREVVLSWDAEAQKGSRLEFELRVRIGSRWTKYFKMGSWSGADARYRASSADQSDDDGFVDTDILKLRSDANAAQLRVTLRAASEAYQPILRAVSISFFNPNRARGKVATSRLAYGVELPVPALSQQFEGKKTSWCSPTSVAMVLSYWSNLTGRNQWRKTPSEVAEMVKDASGEKWAVGNWSFNVAYVNDMGNGLLRAFVTRLDGIDQLELLVQGGIPVVTSCKWSKGELTNASIPSTKGHLLVVKGITKKGDIIVNDPASVPGEVRRTYAREQFDRAWRSKGRTAYIIHPRVRPLPDGGVGAPWK